MQTENRLFDDLARVASGAINTLGGLREEIELRVKERVERFAAEMDLVSREEFDAVKAMAAKARAEQETLAQRLAELEEALAQKSGAQQSGEAAEATSSKRQASGASKSSSAGQSSGAAQSSGAGEAKSQGGSKAKGGGSSGGAGSGTADKATS